jgi:hypothetical protein
MEITVSSNPRSQAPLPVHSCFFCGMPAFPYVIECCDDSISAKVIGLVCTDCVQQRPEDLQAVLRVKVDRMRTDADALQQRAAQLMAHADVLERMANQQFTMPSVEAMEVLQH